MSRKIKVHCNNDVCSGMLCNSIMQMQFIEHSKRRHERYLLLYVYSKIVEKFEVEVVHE